MRQAMTLFALTVVLIAAPRTYSAEPGKQVAARLDTQLPVKLDYLLYLPADYDQQASWPLLLFLHGAGERGNDLDKVKVHGPPKLIAEGKQFPFVVVSPQCPTDRYWQPTELTALLDEIVAKYKIDQDRIYLTGLSMGGFGTWSLASVTPKRFAAIVPICGGGDTIWARRIAPIPTWVFHGAKDTAVPLKRSEDMVEAIKKVDGNIKFTIYPEAGHDSWTETYANEDLYKWLLEHKRAAK